ncbi:hypothetical protein, partial [Duodenibacillus massiliensis]|uniref:hypothetical protein n=1 Tax=Duodenibacillus massiliensis TaxID=1852381 RepID=UPI003076E9FD
MSAGTVSQEKEIARLLRAMDRSRRDTNRECYNADGTVKAAGKKIVWKESKTYKATKEKRLFVHSCGSKNQATTPEGCCLAGFPET